jgi:hypothetical protein
VTRLWGRQTGFESRKGEQILRFSKICRPDLGLNQPPIQWIVGPLGGWKQLGHDVNHWPAFTVLVKSEWSFTFDSSICLRDIDKDLPHSSQLYILCLVVVFSVITLGFHPCFISSLWLFDWTYELYIFFWERERKLFPAAVSWCRSEILLYCLNIMCTLMSPISIQEKNFWTHNFTVLT